MELVAFEELEKKVDQLIRQHIELNEENKRLNETLNLKDKEIENLYSKLEKIGREKGLIREKVETLLKRVEGLIQAT